LVAFVIGSWAALAPGAWLASNRGAKLSLFGLDEALLALLVLLWADTVVSRMLALTRTIIDLHLLVLL
jgi:hypothetical protein